MPAAIKRGFYGPRHLVDNMCKQRLDKEVMLHRQALNIFPMNQKLVMHDFLSDKFFFLLF